MQTKKRSKREKSRTILSFSFIRFQIHVTICTCDVIMVTYAEAERQNYKGWKSVRFMNKTFKASQNLPEWTMDSNFLHTVVVCLCMLYVYVCIEIYIYREYYCSSYNCMYICLLILLVMCDNTIRHIMKSSTSSWKPHGSLSTHPVTKGLACKRLQICYIDAGNLKHGYPPGFVKISPCKGTFESMIFLLLFGGICQFPGVFWKRCFGMFFFSNMSILGYLNFVGGSFAFFFHFHQLLTTWGKK